MTRRRILTMPMQPLERIVSGGQTGVDRAALDAAIRLAIPHGGWCPRGRRAEDGRIPDRYQLRETASPRYPVRTEQNVLDSDATLILCRGAPAGGTELTWRLAKKHGKPVLVVDLNQAVEQRRIEQWLALQQVAVLNVAGPRESENPGIAAAAGSVIEKLLAESASSCATRTPEA